MSGEVAGAAAVLSPYWVKKFEAIEALPKDANGRPTFKKAAYRQIRQSSRIWGLIFGPFYYIKLGSFILGITIDDAAEVRFSYVRPL